MLSVYIFLELPDGHSGISRVRGEHWRGLFHVFERKSILPLPLPRPSMFDCLTSRVLRFPTILSKCVPNLKHIWPQRTGIQREHR